MGLLSAKFIIRGGLFRSTPFSLAVNNISISLLLVDTNVHHRSLPKTLPYLTKEVLMKWMKNIEFDFGDFPTGPLTSG